MGFDHYTVIEKEFEINQDKSIIGKVSMEIGKLMRESGYILITKISGTMRWLENDNIEDHTAEFKTVKTSDRLSIIANDFDNLTQLTANLIFEGQRDNLRKEISEKYNNSK